MKRISFFIFVMCALYVPQYVAAQAYPVPGGDFFRQEGIGSWYGPGFDGRPTASGEIFDSSQYTAAHPDLPFGTILTVTNKHNNRQVNVRVNDRGPFVASRIIDVSRAAAEYLDMIITGTAPLVIETRQSGYSAPPAPQYPAQPQIVYPPAQQPQIVYPPAPQPQVMYPPAAQPQVMYPPAPQQPQAVYPPAAQPQVMYSPAPQQPQVVIVEPPAPQYQAQPQVVYPSAQQPQVVYPPATQYQTPPAAQQPQIIIVEPPLPPPPVPAAPSQVMDPYYYVPAPSAQVNPYQQPPPEQVLPAPVITPPPAPPPAPPPMVSAPAPLGVKFIPAIDPLPGKKYKLQIGSYKDPRSAVSTYEKLCNVGLGPSYERYGDYYRVVLAGIPGTEVQSVADKLGSAGFSEAVIREEN